MQGSSRLLDMVSQLNAGKTRDPKPEVDKEKPKKKPPAKPRATKAASSGGPPGSEDSSGQNLTTKVKVKVKGAADGPPARAPAPAAAIALAASALPGAAPLDPSTAPLLKRVKDVLELLQARNGSQFTPAQIREISGGLNLETDMALVKEVHHHPRITYKGAPPAGSMAPVPTAAAGWYAYLPEIPGIYDKAGLLNYVRDNKGPAVVADSLKRCYLGAPEDLVELRKDGLVFIVGHPDAEKETVFVRDMMGIEGIQDDVRTMWFEVTQEHVKDHIPRGMQELQTAVVKAGLRSALANQPVKRMLPGAARERAKKPRQQRFNVDKATNAHLPFLFTGSQPKNIDS